MLVNATRLAIKAYIEDLSRREPGNKSGPEIVALELLLGAFKGVTGKQFKVFNKEILSKITVDKVGPCGNQEQIIQQALQPLERLLALMGTVATAARRDDMKTFIGVLQRFESVSIKEFVDAVQYARRGLHKEPPMSLEDLKNRLDPSLGDDEAFKPILAELRKLSEDDFREVANTVLNVAFKSKKQGIDRLNKLHKAVRSRRSRRQVLGDRSAA